MAADPRGPGRRSKAAVAGASTTALREKLLQAGDLRERAPARRPALRRDPADHAARWASCPAPTARRCSPAARPRRWSPPPSAPPRTPRSSTPCRRPSTASASCSTTTSRPSRSGEVKFLRGPRPARDRPRRPGRAVAARDAAGRGGASPTPSASSPTSSSRTARPRWPRVCGGTLALMDAGVPIKSPVAGVAMGLVMDGDAAPGPHRHRGRGGPLRRHGLQGRRDPRRASPPCRWTSRSAGVDARAHGRGPRAGPRGPAPHPRPDARGARRSRAPTSAPTRRASSPSGSRWTRSATSSGRAAR